MGAAALHGRASETVEEYVEELGLTSSGGGVSGRADGRCKPTPEYVPIDTDFTTQIVFYGCTGGGRRTEKVTRSVTQTLSQTPNQGFVQKCESVSRQLCSWLWSVCRLKQTPVVALAASKCSGWW